MVKAQRSFVKTNLKIPVCRTESISIAAMRYGVWLLTFAKRNRRKPAVDEVPSAAGFAWAIPHNSARASDESFSADAFVQCCLSILTYHFSGYRPKLILCKRQHSDCRASLCMHSSIHYYTKLCSIVQRYFS